MLTKFLEKYKIGNGYIFREEFVRKRDIVLNRYKEIEKSIVKRYRRSIWRKFVRAINSYELIEDGDKIGICISGSRDSFLLAKLMQELYRHRQINFEQNFIFLNLEYKDKDIRKIKENAQIMNIPIEIVELEKEEEDKINEVQGDLYYKVLLEFLYSKARDLGCNKIAIGDQFDDVVEEILIGILYNSQIKTIMPKDRSQSFEGMELIRPIFSIKKEDIVTWAEYNNLFFVDHKSSLDTDKSHKKEIKDLIAYLRSIDDSIDSRIFKSVENVNLETIIAYKKAGKVHHFLDEYDRIEEE